WVTVDASPVPRVVAAPVTPPRLLTFTVAFTPPAATPGGTYRFQLSAYCDGVFLAAQSVELNVDACTPSSPDVVANSLLAVGAGPGPAGEFRWRSTGSGSWNLHATADKTLLPALWSALPTVVAGAVPTTSVPDPGGFPAGDYQV